MNKFKKFTLLVNFVFETVFTGVCFYISYDTFLSIMRQGKSRADTNAMAFFAFLAGVIGLIFAIRSGKKLYAKTNRENR
jgi:cytochrome c oxidase assembly factor CtaG